VQYDVTYADRYTTVAKIIAQANLFLFIFSKNCIFNKGRNGRPKNDLNSPYAKLYVGLIEERLN
jgi:hypothetical protein